MDLPIELKLASEKLVAGYKQAQLKKIAQDLSERYRNESGSGKTLLSKDIEAAVYALVRMPATYGAVSDAIKYALEFFNDDINTLLDVGAGSGAATWAAINQLNLKKITCIEREGAMRRVGESLMKEGNGDLSQVRWIGADISSSRITQSADLVISSYVINEMAKKDYQFVLDSLWNATDKLLIIVEPGTPVGFSVIKHARDYLLSKGAHIVAPCPHESSCKLTEEDWCHFTCRVQRSKIHKVLKDADVPYEDEKYSYMAFAKQKQSCAKARILRHPYIDKGQIRLELCTTKENKNVVIKKKDGALFKMARKSKHGDSIIIE